jgi:hypothetical protein
MGIRAVQQAAAPVGLAVQYAAGQPRTNALLMLQKHMQG